jgi:hypothetical protein
MKNKTLSITYNFLMLYEKESEVYQQKEKMTISQRTVYCKNKVKGLVVSLS